MSGSGCSAQQDLAETCILSQKAFEGRFLKVYCDQVQLPSGQTGHREYIDHPGAVVIVALTEDGQLVMERQFRYPLSKVMIEFPAGKLDPGEDPVHCGQRELLEETGYIAGEWAVAGVMHNAIAYSNEVIHIHFARHLRMTSPRLDDGEFLEVFTSSIDALMDGVRNGQVTDAKTITALFWLEQMLKGQWQPQWQTVLKTQA